MTLLIEGFRNLVPSIISFILVCCVFTFGSNTTYADSKVTNFDQKKEIKRSLESLRDQNYQTWQMIVYPTSKDAKNLTLRIVGYPGSLRIDHPTDVIVNSGRKSWVLKDITKNIKNKAETLNDSAAEFDLSALISELEKNRPLRLTLPGLINDLPIPPYLVGEWRSLTQ